MYPSPLGAKVDSTKQIRVCSLPECYKRARKHKNLIESDSFARNGPVIVAITKFLIVAMLYLRIGPVVLLQNYHSKPFGDCEHIVSFS